MYEAGEKRADAIVNVVRGYQLAPVGEELAPVGEGCSRGKWRS